jgi:pyrroline-5-carboxylate reductase
MPSQQLNQDAIAFIGGGNMASAIIGGLLRQGLAPGQIQVVEPLAEQRERLEREFNISTMATPQASLQAARLMVWAVKPQAFTQAALQVRPYASQALHLSVAAGIRTDSISRWLGHARVVRAMPNTPALIGMGLTALFAKPDVSAAERDQVQAIIQTTGDCLWLSEESQLDAVTALSGSGPAYVFYFIEAMIQAGVTMGLSAEQSRQLALGTFTGATALASQSTEPPEILRARVTSKGGTTYAAITAMDQSDIKNQFILAIKAAQQRATELGDEFGNS